MGVTPVIYIYNILYIRDGTGIRYPDDENAAATGGRWVWVNGRAERDDGAARNVNGRGKSKQA